MAENKRILPRKLNTILDESLQDTPVVCLLGPRQCGKSTLAQSYAPGRAYFDLDDDNLADIARDDPSGFIRGLPEKVTLDEVQRAPEILRAVKVAVDRNRIPGRFILTGSANLLLLPRASESLAGRMEIHRLHPLTESEKEEAPGAFLDTFLSTGFQSEFRKCDTHPHDLPKRLITGGYPEACTRSQTRVPVWHRNYLQTIFEKDAPEISNIRASAQLGKLLTKLALQSGSLLNKSSLSRDLDLDRETIDHYLEVLQRLFLLRLLPAWHRNRKKRLVKSPKVHLMDSGLAATLMDLSSTDWNVRRKEFGHLLESFALQQLIAQAGWTDPRLLFHHYRDRDQVEVDCVITRGNDTWGVEVKASRSVKASDYKGLKRLADQAGSHFQSGIILYCGDNVLPGGDPRFFAVPISKLWNL